MQKIAIITDSSCDLTIDEIKEYNLNIPIVGFDELREDK